MAAIQAGVGTAAAVGALMTAAQVGFVLVVDFMTMPLINGGAVFSGPV